MHFNVPDPWIRDGEFSVHANPRGPAGHFAIIEMGDEPQPWKIGLTLHDVSDCDRIIRAASAAKRMLETICAQTPHEFTAGAGPNGQHCTACGLIKGVGAHAAPESGPVPVAATPATAA